MKVLSTLKDGRIQAENILAEISLGEYLEVAKSIIDANPFQRKRVSSSATIYSLLKEDFKRGCVLPPIVLSLGIPHTSKQIDLQELKSNSDKLVILDGLQRTHTLFDLVGETSGDPTALKSLLDRPLRVEIYIGLNRVGVLYRMLTLNTGQTPMSLRHQIEMLYIDFSNHPFNGIKLIKEVDDEAPSTLGEYSFKSMVEGFNSYIERNELPIDRFDLFESIKTLENLSKEAASSDLFPEFATTYHSFVKKLHDSCPGYEVTEELLETLKIKGMPFGKDIRRIFSKSQAMTGFGAAIGKLIDKKEANSLDQIKQSINEMEPENIANEIGQLLQRLEQIRLKSKKIGNSQRLYFHFFFRQLFTPNGDAYIKVGAAAEAAYQRYETEMM
jgi:hypothetical protein